MSKIEPQDLDLSMEDIDQMIEESIQTHMQMTQNVGMLIGQLSDMSHTTGRYQELKRQKMLLEEAQNATKH